MQRFTPCLWFDTEAEEAARFYVSIFKNSKITDIARYGGAGAEVSGKREGTVMTVAFRLDGQDFLALNGGPQFTFSPAISLMVNCETQEEIDDMWEKLSMDGEPSQCGWITDKFGVSWQVVPTCLSELMQAKDPEQSNRVMQALLGMRKIDIDALKRART